jgi:hypothetical protein
MARGLEVAAELSKLTGETGALSLREQEEPSRWCKEAVWPHNGHDRGASVRKRAGILERHYWRRWWLKACSTHAFGEMQRLDKSDLQPTGRARNRRRLNFCVSQRIHGCNCGSAKYSSAA